MYRIKKAQSGPCDFEFASGSWVGSKKSPLIHVNFIGYGPRLVIPNMISVNLTQPKS